MKKIVILLGLTILASCSKHAGMTTSKVKLFGGNLATTSSVLSFASNGLIFYGQNSNGKSFAQKIDSDSVTLEFPNGTWNFYAVGWEPNASGTTPLTGKVYCGSFGPVNLTGTDATIQMNLLNQNCSAFSTQSVTSTDVKLPNRVFYTCANVKDITSANYNTDCSRNWGNGYKNNRGFATAIKLMIPNYKNYPDGGAPGQAMIASECLKMNSNTSLGQLDSMSSAIANNLNLPDPGKGLSYGIKVYYTNEGCDDSQSNDVAGIFENDSPRVKSFPIGNTTKSFATVIESNENQLCNYYGGMGAIRINGFAGGYGTSFSPYSICTPEQFNLIGGTNFSTNSSLYFELANDLNFYFKNFIPIGSDINNPASSFTGSLEGNFHRMENILIQCDESVSNADIGIIRNINSSTGTVRNLTINRAAIECKSSYNVGGLIGNSTNLMNLENVKFFGHISGKYNVGGLIGSMSGLCPEMSRIDIQGGIEGTSNGSSFVNLGGIIGLGTSCGATSKLSKSTFVGEVGSSDNYANNVGGVIGSISGAGPGIDQVLVKAKRIEGTRYVGGIAGVVSSGSSTSFTNNMISGNYKINMTNGADSFTGGFLGYSYGIPNVQDNISVSNIKLIGSVTAKADVGGGSVNGSNNVSYSNINNAAISTNFASFASLLLSSNYTSFNFTTPPVIWAKNAGEFPRLTWIDSVENNAPSYLVDECVGAYASQKGTGLSASDRMTICTASQFTGMVPGKFYALKRNIILNNYTPLTTGTYNLDGEGHTISWDGTSAPSLFDTLNIGSVISNLNLDVATMTKTSLNSDWGLLANVNYGEINNVQASGQIIFSTISSTAGASSISIGGLIGKNFGGISFSNTNVGMSFSSSLIQAYIGGIAGVNDVLAKIIASKSSGNVNTNISSQSYADHILIGGIAGKNDGVLAEVEANNSMTSSYTNTQMRPFFADGAGSINNSLFKGSISLNSSLVMDVVPNGSYADKIIVLPKLLTNISQLNTLSNVFCYLSTPVVTGCSYPSQIYYNNINGLSFFTHSTNYDAISGFQYLAWSVNAGTVPNMDFVWKLEKPLISGDSNYYQDISLMRTGGSFEKIGAGF
jgi:hypothetical protein